MPKAQFKTGHVPGDQNVNNEACSPNNLRTLAMAVIVLSFCYANFRGFNGGAMSAALMSTPSFLLEEEKEPQSTFCQALHTATRVGQLTEEIKGRAMAHAFVCNSGHLPLLLNALASIQKLADSWTPIVFAIDDKVCPQLLEKKGPNTKVVCVPYGERVLSQMEQDEPESYAEYLRVKSTKNQTASDSHSWGSEMHKVLINSKLFALRDVLHCDLDAFITDADIVFTKNPWPHFVGEDIIAQNDTNPKEFKMNINSGFMYWRDTAQNKNLSQSLIKDMIWWTIDQSRVNELLWQRHINVTILSTKQFPNGAVLSGMTDLANTVAIHANWNGHFDDKKKALKEHDLWFLEDTAADH